MNVASSRAAIIIATLLELGHGPLVVYVTEYAAGVDALTSISPVAALIVNPAGELVNVPPANPVIAGVGSESFKQYVIEA